MGPKNLRQSAGKQRDFPGQRRAGFPSQYKYDKITLFYSNCKYICVGEDIVFSIDMNLNIEAYLSRTFMLETSLSANSDFNTKI